MWVFVTCISFSYIISSLRVFFRLTNRYFNPSVSGERSQYRGSCCFMIISSYVIHPIGTIGLQWDFRLLYHIKLFDLAPFYPNAFLSPIKINMPSFVL